MKYYVSVMIIRHNIIICKVRRQEDRIIILITSLRYLPCVYTEYTCLIINKYYKIYE